MKDGNDDGGDNGEGRTAESPTIAASFIPHSSSPSLCIAHLCRASDFASAA
jgi:hypothetical protein